MRGACKRAESECRFAHPQESVTAHEDNSVTVCMDAVKSRCARESCRYFHPPLHLQAQIKAAQSRATAVWLSYFSYPQKQTNKDMNSNLKQFFVVPCVGFATNKYELTLIRSEEKRFEINRSPPPQIAALIKAKLRYAKTVQFILLIVWICVFICCAAHFYYLLTYPSLFSVLELLFRTQTLNFPFLIVSPSAHKQNNSHIKW